MITDVYPEAILRESTIYHPMRIQTLGVCMHWTAGREAGDLPTLDGPSVDVQFWVGKTGKIVQFLNPDSAGWHAHSFTNNNCIGIEHEGSGEPYTVSQFRASSILAAWIAERYGIPVRKVDPSGHNVETFRGFFGHYDLSVGGDRVDGNNHTDTVPAGTGWDRYLAAVRSYMTKPEARDEYWVEELPWAAGGLGPKVSSPYLTAGQRDDALDKLHDKGEVLCIPINGRDRKFYIYTYKPGTYQLFHGDPEKRIPMRRGPWYNPDFAKAGQVKLERALDRKLRPFIGLENSYYKL